MAKYLQVREVAIGEAHCVGSKVTEFAAYPTSIPASKKNAIPLFEL